MHTKGEDDPGWAVDQKDRPLTPSANRIANAMYWNNPTPGLIDEPYDSEKEFKANLAKGDFTSASQYNYEKPRAASDTINQKWKHNDRRRGEACLVDGETEPQDLKTTVANSKRTQIPDWTKGECIKWQGCLTEPIVHSKNIIEVNEDLTLDEDEDGEMGVHADINDPWSTVFECAQFPYSQEQEYRDGDIHSV